MECVRAENRKNGHPWATGDLLRKCRAIVEVENAPKILHKDKRVFDEWPTSAPQHPSRFAPRLETLDASHLWLLAIASGKDELDRIVDRLAPDGRIVEYELDRTFSEIWEGQGEQRTQQKRNLPATATTVGFDWKKSPQF